MCFSLFNIKCSFSPAIFISCHIFTYFCHVFYSQKTVDTLVLKQSKQTNKKKNPCINNKPFSQCSFLLKHLLLTMCLLLPLWWLKYAADSYHKPCLAFPEVCTVLKEAGCYTAVLVIKPKQLWFIEHSANKIAAREIVLALLGFNLLIFTSTVLVCSLLYHKGLWMPWFCKFVILAV